MVWNDNIAYAMMTFTNYMYVTGGKDSNNYYVLSATYAAPTTYAFSTGVRQVKQIYMIPYSM